MKINILTKFHKDWMKTVTSTVYTNKLLTDARTHNGRRTSHGHISSPCHFMTATGSCCHFCRSNVVRMLAGRKPHRNMAPDTKVQDGQPDGRTTPKQYPSASGGG
ncbi:hypothetical protein DPMN_066004 [Dreissena polymorpha]|uniref:Uncharacterized protein n=1 Tax=Dreissena polymorpha TaxID=45954 RepID=A0A9D3YWI0_DREPO|nr:hypothetical protein DPMN_066004 [Dreissena polymorpha]